MKIKTAIATMMSAMICIADDPVEFTIKSKDIYQEDAITNLPTEITVSSIPERPERPVLQTFIMSLIATTNQAPEGLCTAMDDAVDAWFASTNNTKNLNLLFLNCYHMFPKCSERCMINYPERADFIRFSITNKTTNLKSWPIEHIIMATPSINVEISRNLIAEKYIKQLKINLRRQGKSFVEYIDKQTGKKVNPLESYTSALQTALTSPGYGNLSDMLANIGIEVATTPIPTEEEIENIKWKILIDELKIDPYKNRLLYWLGTEKFNEFVEEYNNGKPAQ